MLESQLDELDEVYWQEKGKLRLEVEVVLFVLSLLPESDQAYSLPEEIFHVDNVPLRKPDTNKREKKVEKYKWR